MNVESRPQPKLRAVLVAAIGAAALILWYARDLTFFQDEWQYILRRTWTVESLLAPTNEHWTTLHAIAYLALRDIFGLGSYVPWIVTLIALHLVTAAALYILLARLRPGWYAVGGTVVFMFLGTGAENLLWGFQIGFVGAIALGMWALVVVERHPVWATVVLLAAVMTHGPGLTFIVACVAASPRAIRWVWIPAAAYAAWLLVIGRSNFDGGDLNILGAPEFTVRGITSAASAMFGMPIGPWLVVLVAVAILAFRDDRPLIRAAVFGVLAGFAIIGLVRSDGANASRYVYLAAPFLLMAASSVRLPQREWALGIVAFALVLTANLTAFDKVRVFLAVGQAAEAELPVSGRGTISALEYIDARR